ncbi:MAG: PLDc N-terminal domain-containing protein, partial [Acidimicrobiia bacterium]|nr:PLDc N-terminal domain-containing protein [Acidimicrobiia bacterium]
MPLLDLFWTMLIFFLWFAWIMVVFTVLVDIFRNHQMGGFAKALWVFFVIVLPLLGVLIYLIANGDDMARRGLEEAQRRDQAAR